MDRNLLFINKARFRFNAVYLCLICDSSHFFSFHTWFDHITSHFTQAYAQIVQDFSNYPKNHVFPLPPGTDTVFPFMVIISLPIDHGKTFDYAQKLGFSSITSMDIYERSFRQTASNLILTAYNRHQITIRVPEDQDFVDLYYTVSFNIFEPLPTKNDKFQSYELATIDSHIPFEPLLYYSSNSLQSFSILFSEHIFTGICLFLDKLETKNKIYKIYLDILYSNKPLLIVLHNYSSTALEISYRPADRRKYLAQIISIDPSNESLVRLSLDPFVYDSISVLASIKNNLDRTNFYILLGLFYYLQSVNQSFSPTTPDFFKSNPDNFSRRLITLGLDPGFFKNSSDQEANSETKNITGFYYCHICDCSAPSYSSFFHQHIFRHLLLSYSQLIASYSGSNSFPLTVGKTFFQPYVLTFTPNHQKLSSDPIPLNFSDIFKQSFYEHFFRSETEHTISRLDIKKFDHERSFYGFNLDLQRFNGLSDCKKLSKECFINFSTSLDENQIYSFSFVDLGNFIRIHTTDILSALSSQISFLHKNVKNSHSFTHYSWDIFSAIEEQGSLLIDISFSNNISLYCSFNSAHPSITILPTPTNSDSLRLSLEDLMLDLLSNYNTDTNVKANRPYYLLSTLYYCICLVPCIPPIPDTPPIPIITPKPKVISTSKSDHTPDNPVPTPVDTSDIPNIDLQERDPPPDDEVTPPPVLSEEDFNNEFFDPNLDEFKKTDILSYLFKLEVESLSMTSVNPIPNSVRHEYSLKNIPVEEFDHYWHLDKRAKKSKTPLTDEHFKFILNQYTQYDFIPALINRCTINDHALDNDQNIGLNIRTLTMVIIHRFFPSSLLHRLSCKLIVISEDNTHFVVPNNDPVCPHNIREIADDIFPRLNNQEGNHPYRKTYHLFRAIYYYYGFKLFERDLHKYYFIKYYFNPFDNNHNLPYSPLEDTNPRKRRQDNQNNQNNQNNQDIHHRNNKYSSQEINNLRINNYISGKYRYRRASGQRILIKELKNFGHQDFPNVNATDSSRLKKNSDLLQLRSILSDHRDLITEILNQIYTSSVITQHVPRDPNGHQISQDLFDWYLPLLYNDKMFDSKHPTRNLLFDFSINNNGEFTGKLEYNKIILLLFIYYFNHKPGVDQEQKNAYRKFILDLAFNRDFHDHVTGFESSNSQDGIKSSFPITNNPANDIASHHPYSNNVFHSPSAIELLFGGSDTKVALNNNTTNFKNDGFEILYETNTSDEDIESIEQVNFKKLYDEYYFSNKNHIPNSSYNAVDFSYNDEFKDGIAQLIVRTIRSDLPKRLLSFFFIHQVIARDQNPDQFIKILRNKEISSDLKPLFTDSLIDFLKDQFLSLHEYDSHNFHQLNLSANQIGTFKSSLLYIIDRRGVSNLLPSIYGMVRKFLDSKFLNDHAVKQFFQSVPLRVLRYKRVMDSTHHRVKKLVYVPLGNYRSIQRKKVRLFFHLTNKYFTQQSTYDNLEQKIPNLTPNDRLEISSLRALHNSIQHSINSLLTVNPAYNDPNFNLLPLNFFANPILPKKSTALISPDREKIRIHNTYNDSIESRVLNFNRYFDYFNKKSKIKLLEGRYSTNPDDYPLPVHALLYDCSDYLKHIPITKLGSIPRKHSLLAEFPSRLRKNNSCFTISLLDNNYDNKLAHVLINNNFGSSTPSFLDKLSVNIHPFGITGINYSFTIPNWFNTKIKNLKKQISSIEDDINVLSQGFELANPHFTIHPFYGQISTNKVTQLQFARSIKQRQLIFFSYCNRALAEYLVQNYLGNKKYTRGSYKKLNKFDIVDYSLQSLTGGDSLIFSDATDEEIKLHTKRDLTIIGNILRGDFNTEYDKIKNFNKQDFTALQNNLAILTDLSNLNNQTRVDIADHLQIQNDSVNCIITCISSIDSFINQYQSYRDFKKFFAKTNYRVNYDSFEHIITSTKDLIRRIAVYQLGINYDASDQNFSPTNLVETIINALPPEVATIIAITKLENDFANGVLIQDQYQAFIDGQYQEVIQFDPQLILVQGQEQNSRIHLAMLRKIISNIYISAGFQIVDNFDYYIYSDTHKFRTGTIQLLPDTKLGSHRIFLKITFPQPPVRNYLTTVSALNVMGIDLGLRDLCTYAIRTKGINTEDEIDIDQNISVANLLVPGDFIWNHSLTPDYRKSANRLNKSSKFLQCSVSKYQIFQKRFDSQRPLSNLSFSSNDNRFFYLFNVRKAISSHQLKKSNTNISTVHIVTSDLLKLALRYNVKQFNFENLQFFQSSVPAGARGFSYRYSSNLFGQVIRILGYKVKLIGLDSSSVGTCNPQFTSQLCSLGTIQSNVFLSNDYTDRNNLVLDSCKTYSLKDNGRPYPDYMGHLFIHSYVHHLNNIPNSQIILNRDVNAAINLTYCYNNY